jgi:hypothetical protein
MHKISMTIGLSVAALTGILALRAGAEGLCPPMNNSCFANVSVPCSGSAENCQQITEDPGTQPPSGAGQCTNGNAPTYWYAQAASTWQDCQPNEGDLPIGMCTRNPALCMTVFLYASEQDCEDEDPCNQYEESECKSQGQGANNVPCG